MKTLREAFQDHLRGMAELDNPPLTRMIREQRVDEEFAKRNPDREFWIRRAGELEIKEVFPESVWTEPCGVIVRKVPNGEYPDFLKHPTLLHRDDLARLHELGETEARELWFQARSHFHETNGNKLH